MTSIGIVIRTYNEAESLRRTLEAIVGQTVSADRIVLVDSGSTDETLKIARLFENVSILEIPKVQFSYGRALNIGISAVADSVDYVVLLSAHAIPCSPSWLAELVAPFSHCPEIAGVYGKQVPLPEHMWNCLVRSQALDSYPRSYGDEAFITDRAVFFSNANSAIRVSSWRERQFDEDLPAGEDQDWASAVLASGGKLAYQPTAAVYHSHPDALQGYFKRFYREALAQCRGRPLDCPPISWWGCASGIGRLIRDYLSYSFAVLSFSGTHCDHFRARTVRALATYMGRKAAHAEG